MHKKSVNKIHADLRSLDRLSAAAYTPVDEPLLDRFLRSVHVSASAGRRHAFDVHALLVGGRAATFASSAVGQHIYIYIYI